MRETLKIRHYVIGIMYHAGEHPVQILSSRQLAAHFGMARSTVSLALKELVKEGYLISVRGKGNFTNPQKHLAPSPEKMPPLILLIHSDGRNFYYGKQEWESISTIGKAVTEAGYSFRQLALTSTDEEDLFKEILGAQADGLIWIDRLNYNESLLRRLSEEGLPVICDGMDVRAINTVFFDTASACREIGKHLASEGKTRILYCLGKWHQIHDLAEIQKEIQAGGREMDVTLLDFPEPAELSEHLLSEGTHKQWDVLFCNPHQLPLLKNLFSQLGQEMPEALIRLSLRNTPEESERFCFPFRKRAEATVRRMTELLNGDRTVRQIQIPMERIKYNPKEERSSNA